MPISNHHKQQHKIKLTASAATCARPRQRDPTRGVEVDSGPGDSDCVEPLVALPHVPHGQPAHAPALERLGPRRRLQFGSVLLPPLIVGKFSH